jgi:hypothetical protein
MLKFATQSDETKAFHCHQTLPRVQDVLYGIDAALFVMVASRHWSHSFMRRKTDVNLARNKGTLPLLFRPFPLRNRHVSGDSNPRYPLRVCRCSR